MCDFPFTPELSTEYIFFTFQTHVQTFCFLLLFLVFSMEHFFCSILYMRSCIWDTKKWRGDLTKKRRGENNNIFRDDLNNIFLWGFYKIYIFKKIIHDSYFTPEEIDDKKYAYRKVSFCRRAFSICAKSWNNFFMAE